MARSWTQIKKQHLTKEQIENSHKWAVNEDQELTIAELRKLLGKTQVELAEAAKIKQGELSKAERRSDHRVSTVRRLVEAMGGELVITAKFGEKETILKGL